MACWRAQKHRTASLQATASFCHLSKLQETWFPGPRTTSSTSDPFIPAQSRACTDWLPVETPRIQLSGSQDKHKRPVPSCLSLALDRSQPRPGSGRPWGECWTDRLDSQAVAHASSSQSSAEAAASHKDVQSRRRQSQDHKSVKPVSVGLCQADQPETATGCKKYSPTPLA